LPATRLTPWKHTIWYPQLNPLATKRELMAQVGSK